MYDQTGQVRQCCCRRVCREVVVLWVVTCILWETSLPGNCAVFVNSVCIGIVIHRLEALLARHGYLSGSAVSAVSRCTERRCSHISYLDHVFLFPPTKSQYGDPFADLLSYLRKAEIEAQVRSLRKGFAYARLGLYRVATRLYRHKSLSRGRPEHFGTVRVRVRVEIDGSVICLSRHRRRLRTPVLYVVTEVWVASAIV